jgi:hypothetical protein
MRTRILLTILCFGAVTALCFFRSGRYDNAFNTKRLACWIRCHNPREIKTPEDLVEALRPAINPPLSALDRWSGFLTTPIFKMNGVQGWLDYRINTTLEGRVIQLAHSLDGMTTVDLEVRRAEMGRTIPVDVPNKFIRMEIFGNVGRHLQIAALQDRVVEVRGKLMWDGDGFLEIHPVTASAIRILQ